ncbi:MAG: Rne/Rng family ribonuclease [Thermodesulfobacteriota bacterium]|nr:MAG: Rne/Rng family ribonuclease [Thermodesulfobacteriota bacterium]
MKNTKTELVISSNPFETRVALIEQGRLSEFYVERAKDRGITGNIYKGRIVRVLPGMQSAFVEIGIQRTSFLHVSDIKEPPEGFEEDEEEHKRHANVRIQDIVKEGQEIMVQAAKEPIGTKGARVTSYASLPGRYLVLMPTYDKIAISRRISSEKERRRLREIVSSMRQPGYGFIIRTVCEGMRKEDIQADMEFLIKLWKAILKKKEEVRTPGLVWAELDLTLRTIRDLFSEDIERLVIDSRDEYERAKKFLDEFMPHLAGRLELYEGKEDVFDAHGVEIELTDALERKVWLRSGGHIVIDQMEALTAVDVNTGKYVGKRSSEDTIVKTNLEAVNEIVYQLRLRNIGGIIVIDFIDMARQSDREKVYNTLKEALKADKARTNILKISELGIVEMTRKRVRESLSQSLCEPCPYCDGNAQIKAKDTIIMDIYRELARELPLRKKKATIYVSPSISERIKEDPAPIQDIERKFGKKVFIKPVERFHQERYEII